MNLPRSTLASLLLLLVHAAAKNDPSASPPAIILSGDCARFTVLTERLLRLEHTTTGAFDDRATFAVVNRRLPVPPFAVHRTNASTVIKTAAVELTHKLGDCSAGGWRSGEVSVKLLVHPFSSWSSGGSYPADMRPSSVARIMPDPLNLNGTMNHGPAFEGGLDCYSHPPDCYAAYRDIWGQGLLSRQGFSVINDTNNTRLSSCPTGGCATQWFDPSSTRVKNHVDNEDVYILVSGLDYTRALGDWAAVSGPPSLPPLPALGVWYSRYFPYGEESYYSEIINKYNKFGLPLSVGVLDVPWHNINYKRSDLGPDKNGTAGPGRGCNGWDGFTFNRTLFPEPQRFFENVHHQGIKMILSVHMQNGIDHCQEQYRSMATAVGYSEDQISVGETVNCTMDNQTFVDAFFDTIVDAAPIKGTADYWWLDYPGGASEISGWDQQEAASLYWSNRMFAEHARRKKQRPVILARYGGLGQQRDGLGFSGDTFEAFSTLEFQVEMTPAASNVLFGWWSHDIGGNHNNGYSGYEPSTHKPIPGPYPGDEKPSNRTGSEMLLRWVQFGVFSPIFRTHCEPSCDRYVWDYYQHFDSLRAAMRLRDALVPYIYTAGLYAYRTGVSLLRPMYFHFGQEDASYTSRGQYMFGDSILVAPVTVPTDNVTGLAFKQVWLPTSANTTWMSWADGTEVSSAKTHWLPAEIPVFVRAAPGKGAVVPLRTLESTYTAFADPLVWATWCPTVIEAAASYTLYEDDGDGLEYEDDGDGLDTHSTTQVLLAAGSGGPTSVRFTVQPAQGTFKQQKPVRQHLVQFRGRATAPKSVSVADQPVGKITPEAARTGASGWFIAQSIENNRDEFVMPAGALVVATGTRSIHTSISVEVAF